MKIKELIEILQQLNPNGDVCIVDNEQDNCFDIVEVRTCEDNSSEYNLGYADIVIDL